MGSERLSNAKMGKRQAKGGRRSKELAGSSRGGRGDLEEGEIYYSSGDDDDDATYPGATRIRGSMEPRNVVRNSDQDMANLPEPIEAVMVEDEQSKEIVTAIVVYEDETPEIMTIPNTESDTKRQCCACTACTWMVCFVSCCCIVVLLVIIVALLAVVTTVIDPEEIIAAIENRTATTP
jgi:hypothetical protein